MESNLGMYSFMMYRNPVPIVIGIAGHKAKLLVALVAILPLLLFVTPLRAAEPWAPEPNVAEDVGNWISVIPQELQIRLNGFHGYQTTRAAIGGFKLHHPQHIVRLPNKVGDDGKTRAYFAITMSWRFYSDSRARFVTDGYWMVAEMDADAYDPATDQIVDTPGSDGQYVFEEHFSNGKDELRDEYSDDFEAKGSQMVISTAGDWQHPCKMVAFGGLMAMVGQNWTPLAAVGVPGDNQDAVLFYDVRDPVHPKYLGLIDAIQLGIPEEDQTGAFGIYRTPEADWRQIDILGLSKFSNGYYHMGVVNNNYFCHESQDCFNDPAAPGKWVPEALAPGETTRRMGGAQGENFSSYEKYDSVPAQDEPCYGRGGILYPGGSEKPAECQPAGTRRVMFFEAHDNSVLPDYEEDGIPLFYTLTYERDGVTTFEPDGPADHYLGYARAGLENGQDPSDYLHLLRPKAEFYTQLAGNCQPGGGLHVNDLGVVEIFCVTESSSEPIDCTGEAGDCNRLWQNTAAAAPSYGAIRFTATGGKSVTYRGRGLTDMAILNEPPWGPGGIGAGDWANANIYQVEALSGDWMIYSGVNFRGLGGPPLVLLSAGSTQYWDSSTFRISSFRTLPEKGISLFEHNNYYGRMVNTVRSNENILFSCGDSALLCAYLEKEDACNIFGNDCDEHPRGFDDKASSLIVSDGEWSIFANRRTNGQGLANLNRSNAGLGQIGDLNLNDWRMGDVVSSVLATAVCSVPPAAPTSLSYTQPVVGRPLITWPASDSSVDSYKVELTADGFFLSPPPVFTNSFAWFNALAAGTYEFSVRSIRSASANCTQAMSPPSEKLTVFVPKVPVELTIEIISTDVAGLGTGTVTVDEPPASEIGGNFYIPGDTATLRATPTARSEFATWLGDAQVCGAAPVCQLVIPDGVGLTVQAIFRPKPSLVVFSVGGGMRDANDEFVAGGTITINPQGVPCANTGYTCLIYSTGATVTLTATARADTVFDGWQGDDDCADGSVTMSHNVRCEAVFSDTRHQLIVGRSAGVEVSSNPAGIDCGTGSDCAEFYEVIDGEQTVVLTAAIDPSYLFIRWSGSYDCWDEDEGDNDVLTASVTVGGKDVNCSALAVPADTEYALTIEKLGGGIVTAIASPAADSSGIDCSLRACSQSYGVNTQVQLIATASGGSEFIGFESPDAGSDDYSRDEDDCIDGQINMIESISCVAMFKTNVLVVNGDDDSSSKEQNPYVNVLNNMDLVDYDIWHIKSPNSGDNSTDPATGMRRVEPTAEDLANYGRVIWYTGVATEDPDTFSPTAGPSVEAEASLSEYLDNGGCLLMSSPQYHKDRGLTPFMQNYLGVISVTPDVVESYVEGAGSPSLGFSNLTTNSYAGTMSEGYFPFREGGDFISDALAHDPDVVPGSDVLFTYREGNGEAAVAVDNGIFRTAFFGFPFLGIPSGESQNNTMRAFLDFCGKPATDDLFEVNDDFNNATERTGVVALNALKILPGNEDYFIWQPDSDWSADTRFRITFRHATGDLALEVYDGARNLVSASQTQGDSEERVIAGVSGGQTYYLRVYGVNGAGGNYKLTVERASANDFDQDGVADVFDALPYSAFEQFDTDSDYLGDNEDLDDDNDGMPDSYELQYGFDPLVANGDADNDGDGFSDLEEYRGGTDPRDPSSTPGYAYEAPFSVSGFDIGVGAAGAWYNPATPGQGQLIDIEPVGKFMFLAWFTFTGEDAANPNEQHWFTAQGNYEGDTAQLIVYETLGGKFDDPMTVANSAVGTLQLEVTGCGTAEGTYSIDTWDAAGSFDLARAVPGTENVCQEQSATTQAELVENDGWDGAWYDVVTPGQGFLIDVLPNATGDDFIFVAWFTYGDDGASGQRWLTAQGPLIGTTAEITVYETTGGSFDDPTATTTKVVGTMVIEFTGCNAAVVTYSLTDEMLAGTIDIRRAIPGTEAFCESLVGVN